MSQIFLEDVEGLFSVEVSLYRDLLSCLHRERSCLIDISIDKLYEISKEKEAICGKIESIRREISDAFLYKTGESVSDPYQIMDLVPAVSRKKFQEINQYLAEIKGEVEVLRRENRAIIEEALDFLDKIISIIAGLPAAETTYDAECKMIRFDGATYLRREA
ncbi:MAG: flagellar protein FlgN [Deltaproteobacteria bacterium]|nr:flagellar protein FlgN [Deltaproteobacteria bacterium]